MPEELHPAPHEPSSLAAAGFLSRYREPTVSLALSSGALILPFRIGV